MINNIDYGILFIFTCSFIVVLGVTYFLSRYPVKSINKYINRISQLNNWQKIVVGYLIKITCVMLIFLVALGLIGIPWYLILVMIYILYGGSFCGL